MPLRVKVYRKTGIKGNFRELRPAHAMRLKKLNVPIEVVGKRLGHSSTLVTEHHYARIADEDAEERIVTVWDSSA